MSDTVSKIVSHVTAKILAATLAFLLIAASADAQDRKVVISTGEWAPFVSEEMEGYGIAPRLVTAAFASVGIETEYQFYPWVRAMKETETGNADFSGFWFFTDERAEKFTYTDSMVDSPNVFFYRADKPFDWETLDGFPDITVGTTLGYSYSEQFDDAVKKDWIQTEVEETDILNFRKLLRGRVDAFPIAELVGYDLIKSEFSPQEVDQLRVHPKSISAAPLHLIAGENTSDELVGLFNQGLQKIQESGELEKILQSYK